MTDDSGKSNRKLLQGLATSEEVFRILVNNISDYAIFLLDIEGYVRTWNEGAQRIKGYKANEIIGKHFSEFYTSEAKEQEHPKHELEIAKREGRYEEEGWRTRKDGTKFWANVVITPAYDNNSILIGFAKVTRDLTERKQESQSQQVFQLLVQSVKDYAIFVLDPNGYVMTWNEGAERIKGYSASEIIGKHFSVFYGKETRESGHPQHELKIARSTGRYEEEGRRLRKDGSSFWASVVITAIYDKHELIGFAKITRDLTQRLLADQERELSRKILDQTNSELRQALDVKTRFLSTISHEVRTPMAGIIGMTEILSLQDLGEDNNSIVNSTFEASKRLLQLLNNLLEAARMESGEIKVENRLFPLRAAIGDIRQLIGPEALKKELLIKGSCDSRIPEMVLGDELKLRQVLLNLAHNAVKFTNAGEVNISAILRDETNDSITVRFSVADTGIGVRNADREKVFQPFVQADDSTKTLFGGTGLGLSIAKNLVELMGGTIGFESEFGKGSKFWFDIPFTEVARR